MLIARFRTFRGTQVCPSHCLKLGIRFVLILVRQIRLFRSTTLCPPGVIGSLQHHREPLNNHYQTSRAVHSRTVAGIYGAPAPVSTQPMPSRSGKSRPRLKWIGSQQRNIRIICTSIPSYRTVGSRQKPCFQWPSLTSTLSFLPQGSTSIGSSRTRSCSAIQ